MESKRRRKLGPVHKRIRVLREQLGMSQVQLADALGVDKTAVWHWENGDSRPEISRVPKIASVLGVTQLDLVRGERAWAVYQQALEAAA